MKLEKAIEGNFKVLKVFDARLEETEKEAIKLGIEALKRLEEMRQAQSSGWRGPLPGETED